MFSSKLNLKMIINGLVVLRYKNKIKSEKNTLEKKWLHFHLYSELATL